MMLVVATALALAVGPAAAYNEGNRLYAARDYDGAARAYQQALATGPNAAAQFNLGNALFKSGHIGQAILNYRRARYLAPRDRDIAANLAFARAYRVDKTLTAPGPFEHLLDEALHVLSHREAVLATALLFLLAGASLSAWIVRRGAAFMGAASLLAAGALYALIAQRVWATEIDAHPAVVVTSEVNALSGPSEDAKGMLL